MGLISGILLGTLLGIALMAGWREMMRYRSMQRISRVKWLNQALSKLWPFFAEVTTIVIKESVEPLLEDYRPPGISSLKFRKLTLGNVAPKIEDPLEGKSGAGSYDNSSSNSIYKKNTKHTRLKDLQVFAVIRVIFQLAEEIPCISAVVVALLSEAVGGSLTAVPGLSDMINDTVNTIVTDKLQWPHRIIIPIGGIPVDTSELELKPQGRLSVTVVKANALKNVEMIGKSDPYVVVYIQPIFKFKTKVADDNLSPVWNQTFELIVQDKETQALILEFNYQSS